MVLTIDNHRVAASLQEATSKIGGKGGETVLDLTSVTRLDAACLGALEDAATAAEKKSIKLTLRGTNVNVYKVLKLTKLTRRFSFVD